MENVQKSGSGFAKVFPLLVIPVIIVACYLVYYYVLGNADHFKDPLTKHEPKVGDYYGIIYMGGAIVPILMSFGLMVVTFSIERAIFLIMASGKGGVTGFVRKIKGLLNQNDIDGALAACDAQKGAVGNVVYEVLKKYKEVWNVKGMSKEQKQVTIQKELEEATSLEMPTLEKNLTIIATLASVATLFGLLGTVIGMIKAFAALATSGTPDPGALATGISEALINTALGIGTSALAIIMYNFFTSKIDELTYNIDEIGFSVNQSFSANYKEENKGIYA